MAEMFSFLKNAIDSYDFPTAFYDFENDQVVPGIRNYRELENNIRSQLGSTDLETVKDGLSNVLYWGYATSSGRRDYKVAHFRNGVTSDQLQSFVRLRDSSTGLSLSGIKRIGMPQFSYISFVSKILMFYNPDKYVVLDLQLAKMTKNNCSRFFESLYCCENILPIRSANEIFYMKWCELCAAAAKKMFKDSLRAVDIERGIFAIIRTRSPAEGGRIVDELYKLILHGKA